ncbi:MAG: bifunctional aldolase/short-chain dehydrogenase [Cocleimonas sp.]|nr:bifunctional aldolase/short-chain dehydrogenase [Cocleimonas sp.]
MRKRQWLGYMGVIEPEGLPAVKLEPLYKLQNLAVLSDEDMVSYQRANLINPASPNPSVETLLHAFLPHKFIDHTHSTAFLSLTDQPNGETLCRDIYGDSMAYVPFIMPGFKLAKKAAEIYAENPQVDGLVLHKHGIFTFAETAQQAYELMIEKVDQAERDIAEFANKLNFDSVKLPPQIATTASIAPLIRGACSQALGEGEHLRFICSFRSSERIMNFVNGKEIHRYAKQGVITPDHSIRIKNTPMITTAPDANHLEQFKQELDTAVNRYIDDYHAYFKENNQRLDGIKTELDPMPRIVLVPGVGLYALGESKKAAEVAADVAEAMVDGITGAEAIDQFEALDSASLFDMEYWSLEQAKLGKGKEKPLARQVAVITGGAGVLGVAIATLFAENGAEVVIADVDGKQAKAVANAISPTAIGVACDVTDSKAIDQLYQTTCETFGGVDIIISNAGGAWQGKIADLSDEDLRASFELNFFSHQNIAKQAVKIMQAQGTGGALLFNTSKQAINPGANFGAYGLPKSATLFLSRQYALEYGADGIRSNAVNADRIRSGILTTEMIQSRSIARGVSEKDYMAGNLLGLEVRAEDVAQAFLFHALQQRTTADVSTVDGGNINAILR